MTKKNYIVVGYTGQYEDAIQWNVIAYTSKEVANTHAKLAEEELIKKYGEEYWRSANLENVYDPYLGEHYFQESVYYGVEEIEISDIKTKTEFAEKYFVEMI